jgi:hypothetical protein
MSYTMVKMVKSQNCKSQKKFLTGKYKNILVLELRLSIFV